MNYCELVSAITALSCAIAKCVSKEDLDLITAIFGQIASTLATISLQEEANKPKGSTTPNQNSNQTPRNEAPGSEIVIAQQISNLFKDLGR